MNIENFETVIIETDLLILGGGMAACGAAFEASHWAKKHNKRITVVDKAAMERSGAVAMGLSAINLYLGLKYRVLFVLQDARKKWKKYSRRLCPVC